MRRKSMVLPAFFKKTIRTIDHAFYDLKSFVSIVFSAYQSNKKTYSMSKFDKRNGDPYGIRTHEC